MLVVQPLFDVNIGVPLNDYSMIEGSHVYAREFSNAKVLVNPTSDSYVIDLPGAFKTSEGTIVTRIIMQAYTGVILMRLENL